MTVDLDWENLGFNYRKLPFRYISYFKDGKWDEGQLTEDAPTRSPPRRPPRPIMSAR